MSPKRAAVLLLVLTACGGETAGELLSSSPGDGDSSTGLGTGDAGIVGTGSHRDAGTTEARAIRMRKPERETPGVRTAGPLSADDGGIDLMLDAGPGRTTRDGGPKSLPDAGGFIDAPESDAPGAPTIGQDGYLSIFCRSVRPRRIRQFVRRRILVIDCVDLRVVVLLRIGHGRGERHVSVVRRRGLQRRSGGIRVFRADR